MNKTEARKFVSKIADEMMKQGDPVFFTEEEVIKLLMLAIKSPFPQTDEWEDAIVFEPDEWSQVIVSAKDKDGQFSIAALWNGKGYFNLEDKEEINDVLFWRYLPEKFEDPVTIIDKRKSDPRGGNPPPHHSMD